MIKIILATGEEIICFHIGTFADNGLAIHTRNLSFMEAAELFTNPNSLKRIVVDLENGNSVIYYNYQVLNAIQRMSITGLDALSIRLTK